MLNSNQIIQGKRIIVLQVFPLVSFIGSVMMSSSHKFTKISNSSSLSKAKNDFTKVFFSKLHPIRSLIKSCNLS